MSEFFASEVIRAEMVELQELQDEVYSKIFHFPQLTNDEKIEHVEKLELLLEKQRIFYTRLSLSDDPQAKMMGMPENVDMNVVFGNMTRMLEHMRKQIDIQS